ncbi:INO80 complex subunit B [Coemansia sp. RSA 2052]|nr:INO80 complex subunit B [Coemansia sp. RSA 2052]
MPPKRKAAKHTESSVSESTSASDASDVDAMSTTPQTRLRRPGARGGIAAPHSPALSTRRSTRLTAQAEQSPAANPRGRLTRGIRPVAPAEEVAAPEPARRGRGRGRGRGRAAPIAHLESLAAPRRRGRPPGKRAKLEVDDSESAQESDSEDVADSLGKGEDEASGSESMASSEEADALSRAEASEPSRDDGESEGEDIENDEEENGNGVEAESVDMTPVRRSVGRPPTRPGRGRGRGRGRPRATESRPAERTAIGELDDNDMDMLGSEQSDLGEEDGGSGVTALANLTRRQRARLTRDYDEELIELPTEAKRSKFSAEEAALRKSEHARRRKFQSQQRADQLKHETINRLLNKQTSKGRNKVSEDYDTRSTSADGNEVASDMIRYVQRCRPGDAGKEASGNSDSNPVHIDCTLSFPLDVSIGSVFPAATDAAAPTTAGYPPPVPTCSVDGCQQRKKYNVESHAACSLEHWRVLKARNA